MTDATMVISHSDKEQSSRIWKTYDHHPLGGWVDHGEGPHPGAQLRFTDAHGHRFTAFLTNTVGGQLAELELRHRRHVRVEDRIRTGKDTGLRNLPNHDLAQNKLWLELVAPPTPPNAWP